MPASSEVKHDLPRRSSYDCWVNKLSASKCFIISVHTMYAGVFEGGGGGGWERGLNM